MKKSLFIIIIVLFNFTLLFAQKKDLLWVSLFTGLGQNQPTEMTSDASGNIYVVGQFTSTVSQDAFTLTSSGSSDGFIAKYNKNGQIQWLKQIGGATIEDPQNVVLSNDGNYIYISVQSNSNPVSFDGNNVAGTGLNDIYIAKFAVDGTYQWAHNSAYGATAQITPRLRVDGSDSLILTGKFITGVTFYGGAISLADGSGLQQIFISKFDGNGNTLWAKKLTCTNNMTLIRSISVTASSYYFSGLWAGDLTLDIGVLSNAGNRDMFLYKTDLSGNGTWVRKVVGSGDDYCIRHKGDALGYQFLTGYYNSPTLTADSTGALTSVLTFPNAGSNDIFYACYAPDGTLQYARSYGSIGDDQGNNIFANSNHVVIGGQYTGAISFGSFNLSNSGNTDAYMVETDRNGAVLSAKRAWGTSTDITKTCNIDVNGTNIFCGDFISATLNIDGKILNNALAGVRDMFLVKFGTITITHTITNVLCNGGSTGQISVAITGDGTPPYTYLWNTASTNDTITNLTAGWYKVTVTDANLATKVDSAQVTEPSAIAAIFAVTNTNCPSSTDGAINLTPVGGTSPYTYLWSNAAITKDISGLASGWYHVTITDINLCTKVDSAQVLNPAVMLLTASVTTPSCVPGGDGAIDLTVFNGTGSYTYLWNDGGGSTTQDIGALISGTYCVTVTDANLCTVTGCYDVINPSAPQVTFTKTDISCVPGNDGAIDVLVSGGTIPYTYLWNDAVSTQDRTALFAGSYILTVTDAASCSATTATIVLSNPTPPSISFVNTNPTCVPGNDGAIDLIVYSGNPPYTYLWSNSATTQDLSSLSDGTYSITVTDTKSCTVTGSSTIARQFPTATITPNGATTFCQGQNVILQASVGSGNTYQWQENGVDIAGAVISAYTATTSGNYTVIVNSSNGCADTSAITVATVNSLPTIYNVTGGGSYCSGGGVLVGLSNSDLGVNYELFLNSITTSNILAGTGVALDFGLQTAAGTYTIIATDATTTCTSTMNSSATIIVNALPATNITPNGATTFCQGQNVILQASVAGGNTYQWQESGVDIAGAVTSAYTASSTGNYTVIVNSSNGCADTSAITVVTVNPLPTIYNVTGDGSYCSGGAGVSVGLSNSDLGVNYELFLNDVTTSNILAGIGAALDFGLQTAAGTYTIIATDATTTCTSTMNSSATIIVNALPATNITPNGATTFCQGQNVILQASVAGGNTYQWQESGVDIAGAVTSAYTASSTGNYTVIVNSSNGCADTSAIEVVTVNTLPVATTAPLSNTICEGSNVDITVTLTGTGPWLISGTETLNGITQNTFTNVPVAVSPYTITITPSDGTYVYNVSSVTDANCTNSTNAGGNSSTVIVSPQMILFFSNTNPSCGVGNDGAINLSVLNGTSPYTYIWNDGASSTTQDLTNLTIGTYTVTVTDAAGCIIIDSTTIVNPFAPILGFSTTNPTCVPGSDGAIDLSVFGGATPYTYSWLGGQITEDLSGLLAGTYSVIVTDANACSSTGSATLYNSPLPILSFVITNESCAGGNGAIDMTVTNGTLSYNYSWSNGTSTEDINGLVAGIYRPTVTDANGCSATDSVTVETTPTLTATLNAHTLIIFCASNSNGEAIVTAQNGLPPYTYAWSTSVTDTIAYANDLGIGINYVTVTDGCGTQVIDSIVITSLPPMVASITSSTYANCALSADGSATVSVSGGIAPYTFIWSGSASTTITANDLTAGIHYVTISDYCNSKIDSVNIISLPALAVSVTSLSQVSCTGGNNGSAVAVATNGVGPFTYSWTTGEVNDTAIMLVDGLNNVTVTDGCGQLVGSVLITTALPLSIAITPPSPTSCAGGNNGGATVITTNGSAPFTFQWSTNSAFSDTLNTNAFATNLINDTNWVRVTDACTSKIDSVIIASLPPLTTSMSSWPASCPNKPDGKARVDVYNGAGPFTYAWSNSISTGWVAMDLLSGMNYVTVTDVCSLYIDSVNIGVKTPLSASITSSSPTSCANDTNGTAIVTALDGGLPYSYVWSASTSTSDTASNLPVGNHFVTVTDVCGSLVVPFAITSTPVVTASISKQNVKCFEQLNGSVIVTPSNGIAPYTYTWGDTILTDSMRTNIGAGLYFITVTDHCGNFVDSVTINQPGALSLSTINTNVSFTGLSDGVIDVIMSGGVQPYYYNWSNSASTEDLHNIAEGTYNLTVTDENGCIINDSITIVTNSWHIEIYKAFTPNGDGKNDMWNIKHISAYPKCNVTIFDEWGIKVFESTGYEIPWDGKNKNGKILPSATYYYIIDLKDGSKVFTGSVALIK